MWAPVVRHWLLTLLLVLGGLVPVITWGAQQEISIGVLAKRGSEFTLSRWGPTAAYLQQALPEYKVRVVPLDFDALIPQVESGQVDFVLANSSFYVELETRFGVSRIATLRNLEGSRGYTRFGGVVFTRADRPGIETLADVSGKRFLAVHATSLGGYQAAWRELKDIGVDVSPGQPNVAFAGTHDAVVYGVRDGKAEVGTVRTDTLERMAMEGRIALSEFRVLGERHYKDLPFVCSTRLYPEWPFAKLRDTSEELSHQVASALLSIPADSAAARVGRYRGWTVPRNYQPVHELQRELHIGAYRDSGRITVADVVRQYGAWVAGLLLALAIMLAVTLWVGRLNRRLARSERALRCAHDELEQRVAERTGALRRALEELEESHQRLELAHRDWNEAFDAIRDPIFIHDADMRIVHANPAYVERAGIPPEDLIGRPYWQVFPHRNGPLDSCRQFPEQMHEEGQEVVLPSGEVFVSRSFGIRRADGSYSNAIHILEDVTVARRIEAQRRTLSRAVEQAGEGVAITDAELKLQYANPALLKLIQRDLAGLAGQDLECLFGHETSVQIDELRWRLTGADRWDGEIEVAGGGQGIPAYVTVGAIRDDHGHLTGYVLTLTDLSGIKAAEQALKHRAAFESIISSIATRFVSADWTRVDEEIVRALGRLGQFVAAERAHLLGFDAERGVYSYTHEWCAEGIGSQRDGRAEFAAGAFPWLNGHLDSHEVVHITDPGALPDEAAAEAQEMRAQGLRSLLAVPMVYRGNITGMLTFETVTANRDWVKADVSLLQATGEIITNALRRREAERDVRRSEANLSEAQRIAHIGNWVWDIQSNALEWSDEVFRIFGLTPQQFGATYDAFLQTVHPQDRDLVTTAVDRAVKGEQDYDIDHRIVRADGSEGIVHERGVVNRDAQGRALRMLGTVQDVTTTRRSQWELMRLNRALRTLSRGNETLIHAGDEFQLLKDICKVIVDVGGYHLAWVAYPSDSENDRLHPVAYSGVDDGYLQRPEFTCGSESQGLSPSCQAMLSGEPVRIGDLNAQAAETPWRRGALERGAAALIAFPLNSGGEHLGVLTIHATEADAFDTLEVKLLGELADDLAFGILTQRSSALRHQAEAALKESENRYHTLYESAPNGYVSVRAVDGQVLQANPAMSRMLGYRHDELLAMKVFQFYPNNPDGLAKARGVFKHLVGGESVRDASLQMVRKDGTTLWVSLSVDPVFDGRGQVVESRSSVIDISERKAAEKGREQMALRLQRALVQTIEAIAVTIEKRDPYTAGHQVRVSRLAVAIAERLGMDPQRVEGLRLGAMIHDIGKIYVPAEILNRPGTLTATELKLIRAHPSVGYEIIAGVEFPWPVADMIVQHHERVDGSGYPDGLQGEAICQEARIIAVADVVEAMASHRPYRPALPVEQALAEIREHRGARYDPQAVDACIDVLDSGEFIWDAGWLGDSPQPGNP